MNVGIVHPGRFHRLALAVNDVPGAHDWFTRVFGAGPIGSERHAEGRYVGGTADLEGSESQLFRLGGCPYILLSKGAPGGPIANFFDRYGPGVHSLAWEVEDMWSTQNLLSQQGIRIGGVSVAGRFFFMHPRDTDGVLMEWTDDTFGDNVRRGESDGDIAIQSLAWVTAVVEDANATASLLADIASATEVLGNPRGPDTREVTIDLAVGDITLRLVTPLGAVSPYADFAGAPRLCSFAWRVDDLDETIRSLERIRVPVLHEHNGVMATDPVATFGLPIEWTM
jgi:4-hydroxyphenylpyruvate dioxygenase-like putative hemolysin